jgi:predicted Fe-S protein YdhL (DUF1289 family)
MTAHPRRSRKARDLFLLCERASPIGAWQLVFSDYQRAAVLAECEGRAERGAHRWNLVIKRCTDAQADIDGVLAKMNFVR